MLKYQTEEEFLHDFTTANAERIWTKMIAGVSRYYKEDGLAWITLIECLTAYDIGRLPAGKQHRWQFARFFKQRMQRAMQVESYQLDYPMRVTHWTVWQSKHPTPSSTCIDGMEIAKLGEHYGE